MNLASLPDIEFISTNLDEIIQEVISGYEKAYLEQTGNQTKLYPGDPIRIFLYSQALREFQLRQLFNNAAKQNLLKYANGLNLDHLGANDNVVRLSAQKAKVPFRFRLSTIQTSIYTIPSGIRVSPGNDLYFQTTSVLEIPAGQQEISTEVECMTEGEIGNGFLPGQINIIVDPLPFLESGENTATSTGGSDIEDDESFRNRIHLSPEGFSVAGPENAYVYFAKSFNPLVLDVLPTSPADGQVDIKIILQDGELPSSSFLQEFEEYMSARDRRPLTDKLSVGAPDTFDYSIDLDYFILSSNAAAVQQIQTKVNQAISEYQLWQKGKIGRDIDPSELVSRIKAAGAKRVTIRNPVYTKLTNELAVASSVNVAYGGLEDD